MSEHEPWDEVEASLRREFSPPALDALNERIAEAAAELVADEPTEEPTVLAPANEDPARGSGWRVPLAVGLSVAAAVALVWALSANPPSPDAPRTSQDSTDPGLIAAAPRLAAGAQLDGFLSRGDRLPFDDGSCAEPTPPPNCNDERPIPQLLASAEVSLVGECDIERGIDCALHELPAQRALLVRLNDHDENVIVCIEPPWADPRPVLPPDSRYNIFRRTLGEYVLYEITPLPEAVAVEHLALRLQ